MILCGNERRKISGRIYIIELLVVIAIIGILAAVILASLGSSRGKASDAKIKAQLANMRSQAELYTGTGTAFATATCATTAGTIFETANAGLGTMFIGITLSNTRCGSTTGIPATGSVWAVAAQTASGAWCVDSTSVSRNKDAAGILYTTTLTSAITGTACL